MTVSDVKKRIEKLEENQKNMLRLQEYFLGNTGRPDDVIQEVRLEIENEANLSRPIRDLCSDVAWILDEEIKRLKDAIDNATVNIK